MERKMELVTVFRAKGQMFSTMCRKHQERLKNMIDSTEIFIQGSKNFKIPGCQNMIRYLWQGFLGERAGCRPETILKVDPITVTISGFWPQGQNSYSAEVP